MQNINKKSIGQVIFKSQPYCLIYNKRVTKNCFSECFMHCRYRYVCPDKIDEAEGKPTRNGYKEGKWKNIPNYFCYVDTKIVDVPDFAKEDND